MISAVLIGAIVAFISWKMMQVKVDFKSERANRPINPPSHAIKKNMDYIEFLSGFSKGLPDLGGNVFLWIMLALIFSLIGGYSELLFVDVQWLIIQSGFCVICGLFVYPIIGASVIVGMRSERENKRLSLNQTVAKYITWPAKDAIFVPADCFFCHIIIDGNTPEEKLDEIRDLRNRCYKDGRIDIAEVEPYLNELNSLRKQMGLEESYGELQAKSKDPDYKPAGSLLSSSNWAVTSYGNEDVVAAGLNLSSHDQEVFLADPDIFFDSTGFESGGFSGDGE